MGYVTPQEVREQAGFQYKERGESLGTGDGTTVIFYVDKTPIVGRNYLAFGAAVGTPELIVYASGTPVTISAVATATGKITLAAAVATPLAVTADYDWSPLEDVMVDKYIAEAHSMVLSHVSGLYTVPLTSVPELIRLIEKRLAAGLLLDKEYSVGGDESEDTRGKRWITWAEKKLKDIASGALALVSDSGAVLAQKTSSSIDGWPNDTTEDATESESGGAIHTRIKKEF